MYNHVYIIFIIKLYLLTCIIHKHTDMFSFTTITRYLSYIYHICCTIYCNMRFNTPQFSAARWRLSRWSNSVTSRGSWRRRLSNLYQTAGIAHKITCLVILCGSILQHIVATPIFREVIVTDSRDYYVLWIPLRIFYPQWSSSSSRVLQSAFVEVTPCVDEAYLQFCHRIIGLSVCWRVVPRFWAVSQGHICKKIIFTIVTFYCSHLFTAAHWFSPIAASHDMYECHLRI